MRVAMRFRGPPRSGNGGYTAGVFAGLVGCGGSMIAQDEASSIVYGMPREAALIGAAGYVLPPVKIAARLAALGAAVEVPR